GRSVNRGNDQLLAALVGVNDLRQARLLRRLTELADVGPGRKGATRTNDDQRLGASIRQPGAQCLRQTGANVPAKRINRRVIDSDHTDPVAQFIANDLTHVSSLCGWSTSGGKIFLAIKHT